MYLISYFRSKTANYAKFASRKNITKAIKTTFSLVWWQNNFSQKFFTCVVATSNDDGWFTNTPSPHWSRIESLYGKTLRSSIFFSKLMTRDWFLDPVIFCVFWEGLKRSLASPNLIWIDEDEKNFSVINTLNITLSKQVHGHNVDKHSLIHYSKVPNSRTYDFRCPWQNVDKFRFPTL